MSIPQPVCCKHRNSSQGPSEQQQHFNYLRNNSSSVYNIFTWQGKSKADSPQTYTIDARANINLNENNGSQHHQPTSNYQSINANQRPQSVNIRDKRVSFDDTNIPRLPTNKNDKLNISAAETRVSQTQKSTMKQSQYNQAPKRDFSATQARIRQEQQQAKNQNRRKVQEYVQSQKPYTRDFPNSKYQNYFGRAALQSYGRANTNEPAGGIIYGNHQKTFNVNPHCYTNQPTYYQSHTTALNFGKRTKLNEEGRWNLLQKQLTKKLGLKDKNEHIKEGKEIVFVDVDDSNMYDAMRQNLQFKKTHRDQIRQAQNQYKREKQAEKQAKIEEFYANKKAKIAQGLQKTMNSTMVSGYSCDRAEQDRIKQQVIYRYHDANGNQRIAVDRHGITCYVDMNFPENDAAYTEELKNRMPIFPIQCKQQDRNIDPIRRENYQKSLENVYPSHYLLPNCQQPEILKMLSGRAGNVMQSQNPPKKREVSQGRAINNKGQAKVISTFPGNTNKNTKNSALQSQLDRSGLKNVSNINQGRTQFAMGNESLPGYQQANKNQLINKAWNDSNLADSILNQEKVQCCGNHHLPSNQKDPYNYRGVSAGRIPIAGKNRN